MFALRVDAKQYNERYYQNKWCSQWNGVQEVRLIDFSRVDCITKNYAVEFDFVKKWAECFGQATHYGDLTGKKSACILIIEKPADFIQYYKVMPTLDATIHIKQHHPLPLTILAIIANVNLGV